MDFPEYSWLFIFVLGFKWFVYLWDEYLTLRQRNVVKSKVVVPQPLAHVLDEATMNKSRSYSLDKMNFGFWHGLYNEIETTIMLAIFALPWIWGKCGNFLLWIGLDHESEILQSLLFVFLFSIYGLITGK